MTDVPIRINLFSDTVTRPGPEMRRAIAEAEVGDDMSGEDPTVNRLEAMCCELFEKPAAVFACSGTQANQMAVWAHCVAGDELIAECTSHVVNYEAGAPAVLSGVCWRTVAGCGGLLDVDHLRGVPRPPDQHFARTRLLVLENTTNTGGGSYYTLDEVRPIRALCRQHGLRLHLDGARLFNALVETGERTEDWGDCFDSISICLSKGLGAPVGSLLIGDADFIAEARRFRKVMGGGWRQAGYLAAAGLYALQHHVDRLRDDNARARRIGEVLAALPWVQEVRPVRTNIIVFDLADHLTAEALLARLQAHGILASPFGPRTVRFVLHLDVTEEMVAHTIEVLQRLEM